MDVCITHIGENLIVQSNYGIFKARWGEDRPVRLQRYSIELECTDVVNPSLIILSDSKHPNITYDAAGNYFTGFVEEIDEDIMFFRVGTTLIMIEIVPSSFFAQLVGRYITILLVNLVIYDTDL